MGWIVMSTAGSRGDVLPFVPVARTLQHRGHAVEFVVPSGFHERLRAEGFPVRAAGWEIGPEELAALGHDWSKASGLPMMRAVMRELVLPRLDEAHAALEAVADGADLLVCHVNQVMAPIVSARTGVPYAALSFVWDGGRTATVPGDVEEFLSAGEPPVLVRMGSATSESSQGCWHRSRRSSMSAACADCS
jgi:UDP:flavonoid glycosyltransferase YjiC (YdhE family)